MAKKSNQKDNQQQMEEASYDVARVAGQVPEYPTDANTDPQVQAPEGSTANSLSRNADFKDRPDLGGPDLYGPEADLLKDSPLNESNDDPNLSK